MIRPVHIQQITMLLAMALLAVEWGGSIYVTVEYVVALRGDWRMAVAEWWDQ